MLTLLGGGDEAIVACLEPLFAHLGRPIYTGRPGSGEQQNRQRLRGRSRAGGHGRWRVLPLRNGGGSYVGVEEEEGGGRSLQEPDGRLATSQVPQQP